MNTAIKFLIVLWVCCCSILSVLCFSGCLGESKLEEYTGVLFDCIYDEGSNDIYIFLDKGKTQISIYQNSDEYTIMQLYILVKNNFGHKVRIVYTEYECKWFELLD